MWLFALLLHLTDVLAVDKSNVAGPWWGHVIRQLPCQSSAKFQTPMINFTIKPRTFPTTQQELQSIDFSSALNTPIDDTLNLLVTFDAHRSNRWVENAIAPFKFKGGACSKMRLLIPDLFHKGFKRHPADYKKPCSIPNGYYELQKTLINWTVSYVPYFFYGHYRLHFVSGVEKQEFLCAGVEFKIFPK